MKFYQITKHATAEFTLKALLKAFSIGVLVAVVTDNGRHFSVSQ